MYCYELAGSVKRSRRAWRRIVIEAGVQAYHTTGTGGHMLRWAIIFFIVALVAAVFGFLGIATAAVGIARILFFLFLVLFLISLVGGLMRRA